MFKLGGLGVDTQRLHGQTRCDLQGLFHSNLDVKTDHIISFI